MKKTLALVLALVLTVAASVAGTVSYLQDEDSDVNVMTLGKVDIEQHEYERVIKADGTYETTEIDGETSYVLKDFTQGKPLLPSALVTNGPGWDWDSTWVKMSQVDSHGSMQVFKAASNAQDKFVTIENTGRTDAYVRTVIAYEMGSLTEEEFDAAIMSGLFMTSQGVWTETDIGSVQVEGNNYFVREYIYNGAEHLGGVHDGFLPAGETSYPSLAQVYMTSAATNETVEKIDGNNNGTYEILVLSQAVQTEGFADAKTALDAAFGTTDAEAANWFAGVKAGTMVDTVEELREALLTGGDIILGKDITVEQADLLYKADGGHSDGSGFFVKADSVLDLNGHNITLNSNNAWSDMFFMNWGADLTIKGDGKLTADCSMACAYDANSTLNVEGGDFYVTANNDMLYAVYGKINVSGGTFTTSYWNTINIYGSGRVDRVDVSGGSFENWNPASSPDGNLLADGYTVKSEVVDGITWYTVIPE